MDLKWDFKLYVAAATKDSRTKSNEVYTAQARANWSFDVSGDINAGNNFAWTAAQGAGIAPPNAWMPLDDGTQPRTKGDKFNPLLIGGMNYVEAT